MKIDMIPFGPVPSRRLGNSLGINNIPPKICSYACVYCQLGRTHPLCTERMAIFSPTDIRKAVGKKIDAVRESGETIDYLTFVSDGEPTLDAGLGTAIDMVRDFGVRIAVISNASLMWREDVRADLAKADWVSLKVDAVDVDLWHRINRPHGRLNIDHILAGIARFSRSYPGTLTTETMVMQGLNDDETHLERIAAFLETIRPAVAHLSVPTRPPAEHWVNSPDEQTLMNAYALFHEKLCSVKLLIDNEGDAFGVTENAEEDLLSITSVHPMREDAVLSFLRRSSQQQSLIRRLVDLNRLREVTYKGKRYYIRSFTRGNLSVPGGMHNT